MQAHLQRPPVPASGFDRRNEAKSLSNREKQLLEVVQELASPRGRPPAVGLPFEQSSRLGSLDRVERLLSVHGMVNAVPDFKQHPKVMNGFSDLMVQLFGESGRHARAAVGMGSLPDGITVEVTAIFAVRP